MHGINVNIPYIVSYTLKAMVDCYNLYVYIKQLQLRLLYDSMHCKLHIYFICIFPYVIPKGNLFVIADEQWNKLSSMWQYSYVNAQPVVSHCNINFHNKTTLWPHLIYKV